MSSRTRVPVPGGLVLAATLVAALSPGIAPVLHSQGAAGGRGSMPAVADEGTSALSGVVTDATTGRPVGGVMVYLGFQGRGAIGRLSRQISDDRGRFVFTDLPAGSNYFINAYKAGYLDGHFGVGAGGLLGGLITLTEGQWFSEANVVMSRPGSIGGTVLDEHGDPVVGAFVRVLARIRVAGRWQLAAGHATKTDDRGAYRLANLMPGRYVVQVPSVQQSFPASMTAADLAGLTPEQVTSGRAVAEPPAALDTPSGVRVVVGNYLPPVLSTAAAAYAPMFFPNTPTIAGAANIDISAGEQRSGVDFALRPVPVTSVSGVVDGPADVLPGLVVRLMPEGLEDLGIGSEAATATLDASGRFSLINVPAGSYTVDARRTIDELVHRTPLSTSVALPPVPGVARSNPTGGPRPANSVGGPGSNAYFAQMKIAVATTPIANLTVPLRRGISIRGRLVTESGGPPPPIARPIGPLAEIYVEPAAGDMSLGTIMATMPTADTFQIDGLRPGQYVLRVSVGNLFAMSVKTTEGEERRWKSFDGSSGRDFDLVVTLTDKHSRLSGSAAEASGTLVKNAIVIAFPVERERWTNYGRSWRIPSVPITSSGTYQFQSLAAGDYYVVGVPPEHAEIWQDPAKLEQLAPRAARVTLAWGDVKVHHVTVVRVP